MTDLEIIRQLRSSSDPDDQSLVYRWDRVEELKAKRELSREDQRLIQTLEMTTRIELDFLQQPIAYRIENERPVCPRWHWPKEWFRSTNKRLTND